ncbi:hypothetical protein P4O66_014041, partial [Electrophorus voltai]
SFSLPPSFSLFLVGWFRGGALAVTGGRDSDTELQAQERTCQPDPCLCPSSAPQRPRALSRVAPTITWTKRPTPALFLDAAVPPGFPPTGLSPPYRYSFTRSSSQSTLAPSEMAVNVTTIRDTKWLTLEVCREFQRGTCSRPDSECKFAHPAKSCQVENGRVIACFDSLKGQVLFNEESSRGPLAGLAPPFVGSPRWFGFDQTVAVSEQREAVGTSFIILVRVSLSPGGIRLLHLGHAHTETFEGRGGPTFRKGVVTVGVVTGGVICRGNVRQSRIRVTPTCFSWSGSAPGRVNLIRLMRCFPLIWDVSRELQQRDVCYNQAKGRCSRENCKYLHPPPHLKTQLEINGRNNLIQQKNMAMIAQQMQLANAMMPGAQLQPVPMFSVTPSLASNATAAAAAAFNPYLGPVSPGLVPTEILPSAPVLVTSSPNVPVPAAAAAAAQKLMRTDRLEVSPDPPAPLGDAAVCLACFTCPHAHSPQVCREYQRGNCTRGENDCRFAHPADSTMIDTNDNTVTVCMDYIKGRCSRDKCKYFHPPAHLQAKIKAAQHQVNQAAAAAAMGIPPVLPPLPKRPALEKANGATAVFNTGMFQYQQALTNMQFHQQTAFIPSVPMMHGASPATVSAATTSATSVPFATATANQVCSFTTFPPTATANQ